MPYRLINKLQKLMTLEFESKPTTDLTSSAAELSEDVYAVVDEIAEVARETFGNTLRPSPRHELVLKQHGFTVEPGKVDMVVWRTGKIQTPRGVVTYY